MAEIKAELVKQLRERTGVGMMECKKALVATNGDLGEAEIYLRKQGLAKAGTKESRSTKQGLIGAYIAADRKLGVLVEVNCETDFVARTDEFQAMTADIAKHIAETKPKVLRLEDVAEVERAHIKQDMALYEQKFGSDHSGTVGEFLKSKIARLGENIGISRFVVFSLDGEGAVGQYVHAGSQIGVLLEVTTKSSATATKPEFEILVRDIAMQVAAASPQFVGKADVTPELLTKEREIAKARVIAEGKPEKMADKIVEGRLAKFYEEVCLLEQPFIRENSITVAELIKTVSGKVGDQIGVAQFVRYKVGDAGDAPNVAASPLPV
ncbi:MAG TPA: translation elongation factor Ts [Bryobacteraceae bacterium]|jgi:elongation factor Ts|nr:translation elongation factor Ts [Bryobacteraceae bacterium]